ncbi:hypothetical protein GN956_G26224 [Arapaima gigas]
MGNRAAPFLSEKSHHCLPQEVYPLRTTYCSRVSSVSTGPFLLTLKSLDLHFSQENKKDTEKGTKISPLRLY